MADYELPQDDEVDKKSNYSHKFSDDSSRKGNK